MSPQRDFLLQGKITWEESSDDRVSITVITQSDDVRARSGREKSVITVVVTSRFDNTAARAPGGNLWLLMLGLLAATYSRGCHWFTTLMLLLLVFCPSYLADTPLTADVIISTPK